MKLAHLLTTPDGRTALLIAAALALLTQITACGGAEGDAGLDEPPPATFSDPSRTNDDLSADADTSA